MKRRRLFPMLIGLFGIAAGWAVAEPTSDEVAANRRRLMELRKSPEQIERLRRDVKSYLDLPERRRDAISKLDRDLHEMPTKDQQRLAHTLQRYADWLEHLRDRDPATHKAITEAPDAATRLTLIKERRDRDWMEAQPNAQREEWRKLQGPARAKFVAERRQAERERREQWLIARRFWSDLEGKKVMPSKLSEFSPKVREYVSEYLVPYLSEAEKKQLETAEGKWPDYPIALVAIASKHPSALPPPNKDNLPMHFAQLPAPIKARISTPDKKGAKKIFQELKKYEGRPEFVSKVVEIGTKKGGQPFAFEYWASQLTSLEPPMKEFVNKQLIPKLDTKDRSDLQHYEGRWPYYPEAIQELSKKHNLSPPWHILPESDKDKWKWDWYRNSKARSWGAEIAKEKKAP